MLNKVIPRSLRAGIALVVGLLAFPGGLTHGVLFGVVSFMIGTVSWVLFYYFQSVDGAPPKPYNELETLDRALNANQARSSNTTAIPIFNSHEGAVKPRPEKHVSIRD